MRLAFCRQRPDASVIISGGSAHHGDLLEAPAWREDSEAAHFATVIRDNGYTGELVLEEKATNTGENIAFSSELIRQKGLSTKTALVFTKPYMRFRALRTFEKQWPFPDSEFYVASWPCTFQEYIDEQQTVELVTNTMVGDLQRIMDYPKRGFMTGSNVPVDVKEAYELLVDSGYTLHLL